MATKENPAVEAMLRRAREAASAGDLRAAISIAQDAVRLAPRSAAAHAALGSAFAALPAHRLAVEPLRKAVALDGTRAVNHLMLGLSLQVTGRADEAVMCFERAIALDPRLTAGHEALAELHRKSSRPEAARAATARALRMMPNDLAVRTLASESLLHDGDPAGACATAESLLASESSLTPEQRARLWHTVSRSRESLGDYLGAFDASERRNAVHLASPIVTAMLSRDPVGAFLQAFAHTSDADFRAWANAPAVDDRPDPAFLVGFPRSGTTMTENILGSHPQIVTTSERPMLMAGADAVVRQLGAAGIEHVAWATLKPEQIRLFRDAYWKLAEDEIGQSLSDGTRLLVDKFPMHLARLGLINRVFPRSRVVVALRDPRDCVLSSFMQHFNLNGTTVRFLRIESAAQLYVSLFTFYLGVRGRLAIPLLDVRYEDTVKDLEGQARRMLAHLGVEWDERVLRPEDRASKRYVATPSWTTVSGKVNTSAVARWHRARDRLEPVLGLLAPLVDALGYEAS